MIEPVAFKFGSIDCGWCPFSVSTSCQSDEIICSNVFDPFDDLTRMMSKVSYGLPGALLIDEEGMSTVVRYDVEPGVYLGRLRVYEPSYDHHIDGAIKVARLDAQVDKIQMLASYCAAYRDFVSRHSSGDWYGEEAIAAFFRLDPLELYHIEINLMDLAAMAPSEEYFQQSSYRSHGREARIAQYRNTVPNPVIAL